MPRGIPGSAVKTSGAKPSLARKLSTLLDAADETALAEVDEEIAVAEARVKSLTAVREFIAEEVLNRPARATLPRAPKAAPDCVAVIAKFLMFNGPKRKDAIRSGTSLEDKDIEKALEHAWFERDGTVWRLSAVGLSHLKESA